ncbi:MAG: VanZ family protein [Thermoanaerobaculia bacterium]|nr:hypothetical protein [Thermoanaerobaculia bacterium]MCK6682255.1 VanZ family protein [Thermoanaerobaculia bacterium]
MKDRGTRLRTRIVLWAPVAVLLSFEFYLSAQSTLPSIPVSLPSLDKLAHAGYFFLVALFAVRAARFGEGWTRKRTAMAIVGAILLWGLLDEFHQSRVPQRSVEALDIVADVVGALLGVAAAEPLWRVFKLDRVVT